MSDFAIVTLRGDHWEQRVAQPVSDRAYFWLRRNADRFDISDDGIELDTAPLAYEDTLRILRAAGFTYAEAAA